MKYMLIFSLFVLGAGLTVYSTVALNYINNVNCKCCKCDDCKCDPCKCCKCGDCKCKLKSVEK